jgi:hypothetical protein
MNRPKAGVRAAVASRSSYKGAPVAHLVHLRSASRLPAFNVFSGKEHPLPQTKAVFFCYRLPLPDLSAGKSAGVWTEQAGETHWYLYLLAEDRIVDDPQAIHALILSLPDTPRLCRLAANTLGEIRGKLERHVKNTALKQLQAPLTVKPVLKAWMELT